MALATVTSDGQSERHEFASTTKPMRMTISPRYCGLRVNRYGPSVTRPPARPVVVAAPRTATPHLNERVAEHQQEGADCPPEQAIQAEAAEIVRSNEDRADDQEPDQEPDRPEPPIGLPPRRRPYPLVRHGQGPPQKAEQSQTDCDRDGEGEEQYFDTSVRFGAAVSACRRCGDAYVMEANRYSR